MKKIHLSLLLLAGCFAVAGLSGCMFDCVRGSGHSKTRSLKVEDFNKISISGGFKVTLKQDSSMAVKITADDNLLKYIKVVVEGDRLKIYSKRSLCSSGEMTVSIGVKNLEELKASGGIDVVAEGKITTQDMRFKLSGATNITMELDATHVTTSGSGSTELHLKGHAESHSIDMSGNGEVYALDFPVSDCDIQTSGSASSEVNVSHHLNISSSGSSDVKYRGQPQIRNDKSGSSSVEQVN